MNYAEYDEEMRAEVVRLRSELAAARGALKDIVVCVDRGLVTRLELRIIARQALARQLPDEAASEQRTVYRFDRYRNGALMAEGIEIAKATGFADACCRAARLAYPKDVLVFDLEGTEARRSHQKEGKADGA